MAYRIARLDVAERARQKQAARDEDARRLAAGEISPAELQRENDFFADFRLEEARITMIGCRPVRSRRSRSPKRAGTKVGLSHVTREELYQLVWETPLIRLAKRFGLSDVGLRKICKKNGIPTPPLGYWAKRANGKQVNQPPLPPSGSNLVISLTLRMIPDAPPEVTAGQEAALVNEQGLSSIVVPEERRARLHPVAAETGKALRATKVDEEGFKNCNPQDGVSVSIGPKSVGRVLGSSMRLHEGWRSEVTVLSRTKRA